MLFVYKEYTKCIFIERKIVMESNKFSQVVFEEVKSIAKEYDIVFSNENDIEKCREEFSDKVYWSRISIYQKLSEEFIREFADRVVWEYISRYQKLSEEFIREFSDKVDWSYISECQKLSEEFIREFAEKVDWEYISSNQKLSESFIKEYKLTIPESNWLYKTKEEKLSYLKEHCNGIYEIVDDNYVVAYKSTRVDGYSTFNFQYQYKEGEVYESHCDCNIDNENSFGLSVWTKEQALEHYNEGKLFKVYINIGDIGAIVHNNKKIRCSKLTIVSEETF